MKVDFTKTVDLYWFSGSGNTLFIAKTLADFFNKQGITANLKPMEHSNPAEADLTKTTGLIFPVAVQGTYPLVWNFFRNLPAPSEQNIKDAGVFMVDTLGTYSGGIKGPLKKILKKKGFQTLGAIEIIMPGNLMRKKPKKEEDRLKVEKGIKRAEKFAEDLLKGKAVWRDIPVYSDLMSRLSRGKKSWNWFRKKFPLSVDNSICTRCRLCEKNCPTLSWSFNKEQNQMIWNKEECIYCLRCLSFCPVNAISLGGKKYLQNRGVPTGVLSSFLEEIIEEEKNT